MRDYAQYTSRIPSPATAAAKARSSHSSSTGSSTTTVTMTPKKNFKSFPLKQQQQQQQQPQPQPQQSRSEASRDHAAAIAPSSSSSVGSTSTNKSRQPLTPVATPATTTTTTKTATTTATTSQPSPPVKKVSLTPADALQLRQQGAEALIQKLRDSLDVAQAKDLNSKAAIAKSDAVILELRSSLAKVRAQVETLQTERMVSNHPNNNNNNHHSRRVLAATGAGAGAAGGGGGGGDSPKIMEDLQNQIRDLQEQLSVAHQQQQEENSQNAIVGELQNQLDIAHAQMLTADMVRKELEDTLEAEQYTWELRLQDQDRECDLLREEIGRLQKDLDDARSQWKSAEEDWNRQTQDLQQQLTQARTRLATTQAMKTTTMSGSNITTEALQIKIQQMEKEKAELQNCLDEALQELEAVDAELQENGKNNDAIEQMKYLLRWIHQERPGPQNPSYNVTSRDPKILLQEIQTALEQWIAATSSSKQKEDVLQRQVEQYQHELRSREEVTGELRESLKEAVALLKPLQAAVALAEEDKHRLQSQLDELRQSSQDYQKENHQHKNEIEKLKTEIVHLEEQVEEQKSIASARASLLASSPVSTRSTPQQQQQQQQQQHTPDDAMAKIQRAREELRRKRETEGNLQLLLRDAQSRFRTMHKHNEDVAARNRELQGQLHQAERQMSSPKPSAEDDMALLRRELQDREAQVQQLQQALERNGHEKIQELDQQLESTKRELASKEQSEKVLNKTLQDALNLLRPLQTHLEEAEKEKMHISKELRTLRKRFRQLQMSELGSLGDDQSKSTFAGDVSTELIKIKEELEDTVRQLELENSQLHDALEDMSETGTSDTKWRQKLAEVNSRYEVTQNKLEDAHVENHALVKELKKKQTREEQQQAEIERLRQRLQQSESELTNAKSIAKSALIKVEELTMNSIEELSRNGASTVDMGFPLTSTGRF